MLCDARASSTTDLVADRVAEHDVSSNPEQAIDASSDRERPVDHLVELGRVNHVPRQRRNHSMAGELQSKISFDVLDSVSEQKGD